MNKGMGESCVRAMFPGAVPDLGRRGPWPYTAQTAAQPAPLRKPLLLDSGGGGEVVRVPCVAGDPKQELNPKVLFSWRWLIFLRKQAEGPGACP